METLWSLGNRKTKAVEKNLYTNQLIQMVVESLPCNSIVEDWVVWCADWKNWKNLTDVVELMAEINTLEQLNKQQLAIEPKLVSQPPPMATENQNHKTNSHETINWDEKRQFKRIEARFRCIIKSSSLTFRTFTKDISLGGVALEDTIPNELLGNECSIYITSTNNKKNLKFKIKVIPRPGAKFFSFESADQVFMTELNQWLEQFLSGSSEKKNAS